MLLQNSCFPTFPGLTFTDLNRSHIVFQTIFLTIMIAAGVP
nr:MAG TPA: hypothetical protein [Bacteriophage sp.]